MKALASSKIEISNYHALNLSRIKVYNPNIKYFYLDNESKLVLVKHDNTKDVLLNIPNSYDNIAIYEDKVLIAYAQSRKLYKIISYDLATKSIQELNIGNKLYNLSTSDFTNFIDFNNKKEIVVANPDGDLKNIAQITYANLSQGLSSVPEITITNNSKEVKVGDSLKIEWQLSSESDKLEEFDIYKIVNGNKSLVDTLSNNIRSYTYTQNDETNEDMVTIEVVAKYNNGETRSDLLPLKVIGNVEFGSFTTDVPDLNLYDNITFSWSATGANENNKFTVSKKCEGETDWSELFTTKGNSKTYKVESFSGVCQFKVASGEKEMLLEHEVTINGDVFKFKNASLSPVGNYTVSDGKIDFKWDTYFNGTPEFTLWMKKEGENDFKVVTQTVSKEYLYEEDLNSSFDWKVSFNYNGQTIESEVKHVTLKSIAKPTITNGVFSYKDAKPIVTLTMPPLSNATEYEVYRSQYNNQFRSIGSTQTTTFEDKNVAPNESYSYYVVAIKNDIQSIPSSIVTVDTTYNKSYEVIMDSDNLQVVSGTSMVIKYHPSKKVGFEQYEIRIGEKANNTYFYTLTNERNITIEGLEYNKNYFVEVYPTSPSGKWVSTQPAKLTFSTGADKRNITSKAVISMDEIATDHVSFSWDKVPNADKYIVLRSENGEEYESLGTVEETSFVDSINLVEGAKYKYKVKAFNGGSSTVSEASDEVVPVPITVKKPIIEEFSVLNPDACFVNHSCDFKIEAKKGDNFLDGGVYYFSVR